MSAFSKKWLVILNPVSGNGKSQKKWPKIKQYLDFYQFDYELVFTEYSKHSILLVKNYINKGIRNIICIGGDGTLHNIVNGIMLQNKVVSKDIHVGMIPIGTGNDWAKNYHISKDIHSAIKIISKGSTSCQDVGKIEFSNTKKKPVFFNNLAGIGFDGYVVSRINKYKYLGSLSYLIGALITLFVFKNFNSSIFIKSKKTYNKTLMILIGIGKYSGGGMQLTKQPNPFDGLFDVSIANNLNKFEMIKNLENLFNGKITNHKKVNTYKTNFIEITINAKDPIFIQADGELLHNDNIRIHLIPKAFSFYS